MFSQCYKLKEIKGLNKFNTINTTNFASMFQNCKELEYADLSNFNTINIKEDEKLFYHIFFNDNKEEIENKYSIHKKDKVKKIRIVIDYQVKSFENLFKNCKCIQYINFKKFNRNNIDNMRRMFYECSLMEELNLSNFDSSNVIDMGFMFNKCHKLKEIKGINNFNTSKVTNMNAMFQECNELEYLDLSNFNTYNATDM